jgi:hypothetical protein
VVVPHALDSAYLIVSIPGVKPDTTPDRLTLAMVGLVVDHVPPVVDEVSVITLDTHTDVGPEIGATDGAPNCNNLERVVAVVTEEPVHVTTARMNTVAVTE